MPLHAAAACGPIHPSRRAKPLLREHVSADDLLQALRESDCELEDMRLAFLEAGGKFSILKQRK